MSSNRKMNSSRSKSEDSRVKIVTTECSREVTNQDENASFLAIKFEKLLVSQNTSKSKPGREKSKVLKSETKVVKLKKTNQRKPLLRKSKLGEIVSKHGESLTSECSVSQFQNKNNKVFGRKFSLSLDNFNSLSLGDRKEESSEDYSTESFKKINVRPWKTNPQC